MIKSVIFDMDGLLLDSEFFWQKMEIELISKVGINITPEMQKSTIGFRSDEMIMYWYNFQPWESPDFKKMEDEYENSVLNFYINESELMDGAMYIIEFFKRKKLKIGLASSSTTNLINTFLNKFNLDSMFDVIYSAEFEEHGKPHPGVYIKTAKLLDTYPASCIAFEDSFVGLLAAKAALMKTVVVPDHKHRGENKFIIADLQLDTLKHFTEKDFERINNLS
jgi:mannitol-1-/sugar-/sorbitol-6-/2-deoxyglucose-6-phosphatase